MLRSHTMLQGYRLMIHRPARRVATYILDDTVHVRSTVPQWGTRPRAVIGHHGFRCNLSMAAGVPAVEAEIG